MTSGEPTQTAAAAADDKHHGVDVSEATTDLKKFQLDHQWDPNLSQEKADMVKNALQDGDSEEIIAVDAIFTEDSPYEEVRAAVRNTDGEEVANTVRAWILGMIFVTIGSGLNMFLSMRYATSDGSSCRENSFPD